MPRKSVVCPPIYTNDIQHMHAEMNWEAPEALYQIDCGIDQGIAHDAADMDVIM